MTIAVADRIINLYDDNFSMILSSVSDKYLAQASLLQDNHSDMINIKIIDLNNNYMICDETYPGYLEVGNIFICNDHMIFKADGKFNLFHILTKTLNHIIENEDIEQYPVLGFYNDLIYLHDLQNNLVLSYNIYGIPNESYELKNNILDHHLINSDIGLLYLCYRSSSLYELCKLQTNEVLFQIPFEPYGVSSNYKDTIIIQNLYGNSYYYNLQGHADNLFLIDDNGITSNNTIIGLYKFSTHESIWTYNKSRNIYIEFIINIIRTKSARSISDF